MERPEFEVIAVIALRKTQFYLGVKEKLLTSLPPTVDREDADLRLRRAISKLDNLLFVSDEEKSSSTITPGRPLAQLRLNEPEVTRWILDAMTAD
jgi:hypothetical protein